MNRMHSFRIPFDTSQNVSGALSFVLLMLMAFSVAWISLSAGENVLQNLENSPRIDLKHKQLDSELGR